MKQKHGVKSRRIISLPFCWSKGKTIQNSNVAYKTIAEENNPVSCQLKLL